MTSNRPLWGDTALLPTPCCALTPVALQTAPVLTVQEAKRRCMFVGPPGRLYRRAAIFPWGMRTQPLDSSKGSTKVVSARAIRHVRELTRIATGDAKDSSYPDLFAAVMFVVARSDAVCFRVNGKACPEFAKAARAAHDLGVRLLAPQVSFELDADGRCSAVYRGQLPIEWPAEDQVGDCP